MSKKAIILIYVAIALVLIGAMIFAGVMNMLNWDFKKLSTTKYETNDYKIEEEYKDIKIISDTAKIVFLPSENGESSVSCYEEVNLKHSVSVKDGTLIIEIVNTKKWYEYIGINFSSPKITVSLPNSEYGALSIKSDTSDVEIPSDFSFESIDVAISTGDVTNYASVKGKAKIKTSTGAIKLEGSSVGALELKASTGKITVSDVTCEGDMKIEVSTGKNYLTNVRCKNLTSDGDTGDIFLTNVICKEKLSIERDTGDVKLEVCDANEIEIDTDTGDVKGTLLSEKVFFTETDTGRVQVPKSTVGGKCEITTDTGNIKIEIK